jgi:hypothetical protein
VYEKIFSQAVLPEPVQILGLAMRPYSLGHELWLIRQDNPLSLLDASSTSVTAPKFLEAVLICSQTFDEISGMNRDWLIGLKLKLWNRRVKRFNIFDELEKFKKYQAAGSLEFPCQLPSQSADSGPSRYLGAPMLIRVHQFLVLNFRLTESQAWDYPFGLAKMHNAAWMEDNRRMEIKNAQDLKVDAERAKWMADHPDDGIEIIGKEEADA